MTPTVRIRPGDVLSPRPVSLKPAPWQAQPNVIIHTIKDTSK